MQEARLALWSRLREALDLTDAERYYHNVHRALYNHVRRMAPVHCSEKRFASAIRTVHIAPLESLDARHAALASHIGPGGDLALRTPSKLHAKNNALRRFQRFQKAVCVQPCNEFIFKGRCRLPGIMKRVREKYIACMEEPAHAN